MSNDHYGEIEIRTLPPLHVAAYRSISATPEDDGVRFMEQWVAQLGLSEDERRNVRNWGFDIDVSEADQQAGKRGYELWRTVPAHVQADPPVEIKDCPGGLYAVMRITDPFTTPFETIPGGWSRIWNWANEQQEYGHGSHQWLEQAGEDEGGLYLDLYLPVVKASQEETPAANAEPSREVQIVQRPAFKVAGLRHEGLGQQGEIPAMWDVFLPRAKELVGEQTQSPVFYGIARSIEGIPEDVAWEYLAGAEVESFDNLPAGMVGWEVPALTYAVLPARGVPEIDPVSNYFYQEWLPQSEYEGDAPVMVEVYPETFSEDQIMYLHFPVRRKA
jgi:AraC family transcriptional regulator